MFLKQNFNIDHWHPIAVMGLLTTAIFIYWPGLDSRFILDDFQNLRDLDTIKNYGYRYFIFTSGIAGPSGRPLSLATFALQHSSWPISPFDFKLVNLIIHLFNGVLIYLISLFICKNIFPKNISRYLPFIVTGLWLLHPIQLTTTLYVVQRMTLLSSFFILLGVLTYLCMRFGHSNKQNVYKDSLIGILILCFTSLAILSKENGILLPVYILCLELTILANINKPNYWLRWGSLFLIAPILLLFIYLAFKFDANVNSFSFRGYGMFDKSLTEIVVLVDYLRNIIIPYSSAFNVYHDDYKVVENFLSVKYIFSASLIFLLFFSAIKLRVVKPIYSFSILWFLGGHLLESTYLNLELYFEHRNYLPVYGILLGVSSIFFSLLIRFKNIFWPMFGVIMYCGLIISVTIIEVDLWSKPTLQIIEWAKNKPNSIRAKNDLFNLYVINNDERASLINEDLKRLNPSSFYPYIEEVRLNNCINGSVLTEQHWEKLYSVASTSRPTALIDIVTLDNFTVNILRSQCPVVDVNNFKYLLIKLINNDNYDSFNRAYFYDYLSSLEIVGGNIEKGLEYIQLSNDLLPKIDKKLREISLLGRVNNVVDAKKKRDKLLFSLKENKTSWFYEKAVEHIKQPRQN